MTDRPYELVIGIETHVELATESKMFCGCPAKWFGAPPNSLVCPVCLGLPGALPVPNKRAIELAMVAGLALNCEVPAHTKFDRKNYMYPDLPKGYQISQYDLPLNVKGWLEITTAAGAKRVGITRAHLEEDTANSKHGEGYSLVDFNRSGVPLLEIVSEPDITSVEEALAYVRGLREVLVFAGVSEVRFEQGAGRFDVNVSIRFMEDGQTRWPPQSEIKNLNSYAALEEAVPYEAERLWQEWRAGGELRRRKGKITVGWSPERKRTFLQRSKEEVQDYRYFPEPDLVAFAPARADVERLRASIPELPTTRRVRFVRDYGLSEYDARVLVLKSDGGSVAGAKITPAQLGALVALVKRGEVSGATAKDVFAEMWQTGAAPDAIVTSKGLTQVSDESAIAAAVDAVLAENPQAVADYRAGKSRALGALVGKVKNRMGGKGNPAVINRILAGRISA